LIFKDIGAKEVIIIIECLLPSIAPGQTGWTVSERGLTTHLLFLLEKVKHVLHVYKRLLDHPVTRGKKFNTYTATFAAECTIQFVLRTLQVHLIVFKNLQNWKH